jgi:hypothetical protein
MVSVIDLSYRGKQKLNCKNIKISWLWVTDEPLKELAILFQNRV